MACKLLSLLALCCFISLSFAIDEEDAKLTVPQLISKYGYQTETHHVTTEDGYILELHRIPDRKRPSSPSGRKNKPAVLLQHGLFSNSANWVLGGAAYGLGFYLVEHGHDVWMANSRGNRYSKSHTTLNASQPKFWSFGWHEMAVYDLPAMIDYIQDIIGQETSFDYIGHGQGTTVFYAMCSEKPTYCTKIRHMISLATAVYMSHATSILPIFGNLLDILEQMTQNPFPSPSSLVYPWCEDMTGIEKQLCNNILFTMSGFNLKTLNEELVPLILGHTADPVSLKQLKHYVQLRQSGKFRQYDYGAVQNLLKYKNIVPPNYNVTKVTNRVILFGTRNDGLASEIDIRKLTDELPDAIGSLLVNDHNYGHLDYFWGKNVAWILYREVNAWLSRS